MLLDSVAVFLYKNNPYKKLNEIPTQVLHFPFKTPQVRNGIFKNPSGRGVVCYFFCNKFFSRFLHKKLYISKVT